MKRVRLHRKPSEILKVGKPEECGVVVDRRAEELAILLHHVCIDFFEEFQRRIFLVDLHGFLRVGLLGAQECYIFPKLVDFKEVWI